MSSGTFALEVPHFGTVVDRPRLTDLALRSGCRIVLIVAPGGYGKSVLASQLARQARFAACRWVSCSQSAASDAGVVAALGSVMPERPADRGVGSDPATAVSVLAHEFGEHSACLVLDDVSWTLGKEALGLFGCLWASSPGSMVIVTSRIEQRYLAGTAGCLSIGSAELRFGVDDAAGILGTYAVTTACDARELLRISGGHPGLAAVLARCVASGPGGTSSDPIDERWKPRGPASVIADCISQLSARDREILWAAAQLGEGTLDDLQGVVGADPTAAMHRLAEVLPLVRVSDGAALPRFSVSGLVREHLQYLPSTCRQAARLRAQCVEVLVRNRDWVRAARMLLPQEADSDLLRWLPTIGQELAKRGEMRLLSLILTRVGPGDFVKTPELLLLRAQAQWADGQTGSALSSATVATALADACDDPSLRLSAALLLSRIHLGAGSYSLARSALDKIPQSLLQRCSLGEAAQVRSQGLIACCLLSDRVGLRSQMSHAARLLALLPSGTEARARVLSALGLVAYFHDGDLTRAASLLQLVADSRDAWSTTRLDARANRAVVLAGLGRLRQARDVAATAAAEADEMGFVSLSRACCAIAAGMDWALDGDYRAWRRHVETSQGPLADVDDGLPAVLEALYHGAMARGARELDDALAYVEDGLRAASEMDAPLLSWSLQLEQAAIFAGQGDIEVALRCARSIGRKARADNVWPLKVKAALVEAECLDRLGEAPAAAFALPGFSSHVRSGSANWQAAIHIRAYPPILAHLSAAIGAAGLPAHLVRMLPEPTADEALRHAARVLAPDALAALAVRIGHSVPSRRSEAAIDPAPEPEAGSVRLFGAFEVRTPSGLVSDKAWGKRKARLLFAMLASRSGKDVPRDQLVEYLWPEMSEQRSLNNFYVVWSAMKRALSPGLGRGEPCPYVEHVRGVCRVLPGRLHTDLDEFERLLSVARKARTADDSDIEMTVLMDIAELYRGELLPGDSYDDWFGPLRERCRHDFEDAMLRLSAILEMRGDPQGGLAHLRRAIIFDPWREDLYQAALRLQIAAGQRSAAIETYMSCRARLVEDLGIDPSIETRQLYEHVLGMEN